LFSQDVFSRWDETVETDVCEKVDISRILIQRVQGVPSKARVSSIEAANRVLGDWADCVSDAGHDQCDFQIVFEDGFRYHGHYHLNKSEKRISLARHVRKQLTALATKTDTAESAKTDEGPAISLIGADLAESAKIALDNYNI
jgi:capsule polysaccharide export protein KpsE/RkpR